jgi:MoaA/NifB/PqqE/SkfB family radical SAM enzyme
MSVEQTPLSERYETPLYKTLSAPIDVQLELTEACNNRCLHCYNYWEREIPLLVRMDEFQIKGVVRELAERGFFI